MRSPCAQMFPVYLNPRLVAGQPLGSALLKCELKPVEKKDYEQPLTGAQLSTLKATFPGGVCDYSKKAAGLSAPATWFTANRTRGTRNLRIPAP